MKILLSPAKLMSTDKIDFPLKSSTATFIQEAEWIQSFLKEKTSAQLKEMMHISDALADENWHRNQKWNTKKSKHQSSQAIFSFTGEVYRGLDANTLSVEQLKYLQKNLLILSGLYGMLKPTDKVMLYRLEMGSRFSFDQYQNLYAFWREKLTDYANLHLKKKEWILNLASEEYSKVLDRKKLKCPVLDVEFKEMKNGKLMAIMVFFKQARGLMARCCAENNWETLDQVKSFHLDGYLINNELSTDIKLVFTR